MNSCLLSTPHQIFCQIFCLLSRDGLFWLLLISPFPSMMIMFWLWLHSSWFFSQSLFLDASIVWPLTSYCWLANSSLVLLCLIKTGSRIPMTISNLFGKGKEKNPVDCSRCLCAVVAIGYIHFSCPLSVSSIDPTSAMKMYQPSK